MTQIISDEQLAFLVKNADETKHIHGVGAQAILADLVAARARIKELEELLEDEILQARADAERYES